MANLTLENLHLGELKLIRLALNDIKISGQDASFVANLQVKVDKKIAQVSSKN